MRIPQICLHATPLLMALLLTGPLAAQTPPTEAATPSPEQLIREMSDALKKAGNFQVHAEINFDQVLVSGQKIQYAGAADIVVRPPNGVFIDYRDDLSAKRFWYDGKQGTLLDVAQEKYSQAPLPDTIDAARDTLRTEYELSLPLADLVSSNHLETISSRALSWGYLGVHDVEGTLANHIAIVGKNADLQLWIQKEGEPVPLKMVITYKNRPMSPQYQAVLMDWKLGATVSDSTFQPNLPKNAQQVKLLTSEDQ